MTITNLLYIALISFHRKYLLHFKEILIISTCTLWRKNNIKKQGKIFQCVHIYSSSIIFHEEEKLAKNIKTYQMRRVKN